MRWTNPLQWGGNWFPRDQFCGKGSPGGGCGGQQAEGLPAVCSGSKEGCSVFLGCINRRTGSRSKGVIFLFNWHSLDHIWTTATSFEHFGTRKESQLVQFQWRAIRMASPLQPEWFCVRILSYKWILFFDTSLKRFCVYFKIGFLASTLTRSIYWIEKWGFIAQVSISEGKKKEHCNQTSCRLPILKYIIESNTTQKE